jgi:hypothetical protein
MGLIITFNYIPAHTQLLNNTSEASHARASVYNIVPQSREHKSQNWFAAAPAHVAIKKYSIPVSVKAEILQASAGIPAS